MVDKEGMSPRRLQREGKRDRDREGSATRVSSGRECTAHGQTVMALPINLLDMRESPLKHDMRQGSPVARFVPFSDGGAQKE